MTEPSTYSFQRYLEAKQTVDDRARNRVVRRRLQSELEQASSPLGVLEVGAGTGTMLERVLTWEMLPDHVEYTAVDTDGDLLSVARTRLLDRTESPTFTPRDGRVVAEQEDQRFAVEFVEGDAFEFLQNSDRTWDLLIGQAFLDLVDVRQAISKFESAVAPGGLLYFPITFDGGTILEPSIDSEFDDRVERRYHHRMDTRPDGGDSRAGRHLLTALQELGGEVVAAGSSDWVVCPAPDDYPADEAYFLHYIVETIRGALADDGTLDPGRFDAWVAKRHQQIEDGRLVYIAHQLDILGRI